MAIFELSASSLNSFNQTIFDESIPNFSESAKPQMLDDLRQSRQLTHVHPAANAIKCDLNPISQIWQHLWNSNDLWVASNERSHPYSTANACIFLDQCIVAIECGLGRFTAIHCGKKGSRTQPCKNSAIYLHLYMHKVWLLDVLHRSLTWPLARRACLTSAHDCPSADRLYTKLGLRMHECI